MKKSKDFSINRITRLLLLIFTIILFFIFFFFLNASYQQYERIESRTHNLLRVSLENQQKNDAIEDHFNNTEYYLRVFSINFAIQDFNLYKENIQSFKRTIDTLIKQEKYYIQFDLAGVIKKEQHERLLNHYLEISALLANLTPYANNFNIEVQAIKDPATIIHEEQKLITANFNIIYKIDETIRSLNMEQLQVKKEIIIKETQELLQQSDEFRQQIFLCLLFMFLLICTIIYYQFFTSYYERKLNSEQRYADKLIGKNSDIVTEITHEIRTPINALIGILDILKKKKNLYNNEDQILVESAYTSMINTSKTINDILNIDRIESLESKFASFDIEDLVIEIIELYQSQAKLKQIELSYSLDKNIPTVIFCDEFKIRQIIDNLISNAIKYSEKGKINCSIDVSSMTLLKLKITDEGIGIPEEMHANLFKKYSTAEKDSKYSYGIGLGLFITKSYVSSLEGKISFTSSPKNGTTFSIEIPIVEAQHRPIEVSKYDSIQDLPNDLSWLIVDDNPLNILYMKQFFGVFPTFRTAKNGQEALSILKEYPIDIIITDINMPVMTGDELLLRIRDIKAYNSIKIIATSSDNEQVKKLEIVNNCYFDGILTKPFNEKELLKTIIRTISIK